jgi:hypothetical protein
MGGLTTHARHSSRDIAARARSGFLARFERQVPDTITDPAERAKAAKRLMRVHMTRLSHGRRRAR